MYRTAVVAVPLLMIQLVGCGSKNSGPGGGGGKSESFTQSILNLDPAKQKEYGVSVPKGAKALYAPRSVEDFVQSLTLFKRESSGGSVIDTKDANGHGREAMKVNESNGVRYAYQVQYPGGLLIKQECWDTIYGPRQNLKTVGESSGADPRFGGGRTVQMDHWTVQCAEEAVLVRGYNPKSPYATQLNAKKDDIPVEFVNFNTNFESICPGKGESGGRLFPFHRLYKDK